MIIIRKVKSFRVTQEDYDKIQLIMLKHDFNNISDLVRVAVKNFVDNKLLNDEFISTYKERKIGISCSKQDLILLNEAMDILETDNISEVYRLCLYYYLKNN